VNEVGEPGELGVIAILGVGLIGGSLGLALREAGVTREVVAWNRGSAAGRHALECGAIDRLAESPREAVAGADLVVIATPVGVVVPLMREILPRLAPDAVVTDVGSTKRRIVAEAEAILGERFVGGHPMAGSEESGISAASASLFEGATWVLTPTERTGACALERVRRLAEATGAVPRECAPCDHDRWIATLSHLPHLGAYGIAAIARKTCGDGAADMTGGSFRDGTRVAESDPGLWTGILLDNRDAALDALDDLSSWLDRARAAIERGDAGALHDMLTAARDARKWFRNER
jgi:prephenate dehydrogenase